MVALLFYVSWVLIGWTIKKVLFLWLRHLSSRTEWEMDDILIKAAHWPLHIMIAVWGVTALFQFVIPSENLAYAKTAFAGAKIASILALIIFIDQLLSRSIHTYAARVAVLR